MIVGAAWREMFYDRRNSNRCDSETQEIADLSKVGGKKGKKVQHLINKQIIQNKTIRRGSQSLRCSMVKIPHAELGDTRTHLWSKGQGQNDR